jgi:hypothetical protein
LCQGGCDERNKAWKGIIKEAYEDANKLVNRDGIKNDIEWDDAAAFEFFGPDALNKNQQKQIQAVLANASTIKSGWSSTPNYIHVRCDDPSKKCPRMTRRILAQSMAAVTMTKLMRNTLQPTP